MPERGRRRRYVGPGEWKGPAHYQWENRSDVPLAESAVVASGIVERDGLWIGRVVALEGPGAGFGFRVLRTDGMEGDVMLRFNGEWPANVARRKLLERMEHLAVEELWPTLDDLL